MVISCLVDFGIIKLEKNTKPQFTSKPILLFLFLVGSLVLKITIYPSLLVTLLELKDRD